MPQGFSFFTAVKINTTTIFMKDKIIMLLTAFISILCAVWAYYVPAHLVAVALIVNSIVSFVLVFKLEKMS